MSSKKGNVKHRVVLRDNILGLTNGAMDKLCAVAGVVRKSKMLYEVLRSVAKLKLESVLKDVFTRVEFRRSIRVKEDDVLLETGTATPGVSKQKHGYHATGKARTAALRRVRHFQKESSPETTYFSKTKFNRLVREVSQQFKSNIQFEARAVIALQHYIEGHLIVLLQKANLQAIHAKRVTVYPKDIYIARRINQ